MFTPYSHLDCLPGRYHVTIDQSAIGFLDKWCLDDTQGAKKTRGAKSMRKAKVMAKAKAKAKAHSKTGGRGG